MRDELERLALAVQFLNISRTDPERFHIDKSEIVHALRELAGKVDGRRQLRAVGADVCGNACTHRTTTQRPLTARLARAV